MSELKSKLLIAIENVLLKLIQSIANNENPSILFQEWRNWSSSYFTDRELYYENVNFLQNQKVVDSAVHVICSLLDVAPWHLGIIATAKGLVAGSLTMKNSAGEITDCSNGILISQDVVDHTQFESSAKYILVIEKDATFQKLIDEQIFYKLPGSLLITGKGYPDVNTRLLVKSLKDKLKIPVFALVDSDPHGIAIMCVYRFGSLNMCNYSHLLAVPEVKWLGIHPSDIKELGIPTSLLTDRDRVKLQLMLTRSFITRDMNLMYQVTTLLELNRKAEIEDVGTFSSNFLTDVYIPSKLASEDFV